MTYDVWKAPAVVTSFGGAQQDLDPNNGATLAVWFDVNGTRVDASRVRQFSVASRAPLDPPEQFDPSLDPTVGQLWLYSKADFSATFAAGAVNAGDVLGLKPAFGGSDFLSLTAIDCSPQPVTARIDVLPGTSSNVIHPKVKTPLIPVLVYGSNALNVRSIVKSSVRLQNARAADVSATRSRPFDADHDGKLDRRYYFSPVKTGITCGQTSVTLTGRTESGIHFTGTNPIQTVC